MDRKEALLTMKVDDLRKYASKIGITGARKFKKYELVDVIIGMESKDCQCDAAAAVETVEHPADTVEECQQACEAVKKPAAGVPVIDMDKKMAYIETAPIGTLVAFRVPFTGAVKSAKIVARSTKNRRLKLETLYGKQYAIDYDDVVWVRSGERWPTGVLKAMKEGAACRRR